MRGVIAGDAAGGAGRGPLVVGGVGDGVGVNPELAAIVHDLAGGEAEAVRLKGIRLALGAVIPAIESATAQGIKDARTERGRVTQRPFTGGDGDRPAAIEHDVPAGSLRAEIVGADDAVGHPAIRTARPQGGGRGHIAHGRAADQAEAAGGRSASAARAQRGEGKGRPFQRDVAGHAADAAIYIDVIGRAGRAGKRDQRAPFVTVSAVFFAAADVGHEGEIAHDHRHVWRGAEDVAGNAGRSGGARATGVKTIVTGGGANPFAPSGRVRCARANIAGASTVPDIARAIAILIQVDCGDRAAGSGDEDGICQCAHV